MSKPRILAFGGSLRRDSFNQKLAAIAAEGAREAGAEVTLIALRDFPIPLFDQDLEAEIGKPAEAKRLKELFLSHQGLIIASPEYNSGYSAALKNAIDWVSRGDSPDEPPISALSGKIAVIMATSPGGLGGLRGLIPLRMLLGNLGITVLPDQIAIPSAYTAFGPDGRLVDPKQEAKVKTLGAALATHLRKLAT
ncbi:MAG: NAD(P)H-dependent oxidoreductase [Chthoniobacterales bacterium]